MEVRVEIVALGEPMLEFNAIERRNTLRSKEIRVRLGP
jgi:hypothetical protein